MYISSSTPSSLVYSLHRLHRQMDAHRSSLSLLAVHFYFSAMLFDDFLRDHHSEPGAIPFCRIEGLEKTSFGFLGHAHAAIDNADHKLSKGIGRILGIMRADAIDELRP